MFCKHCGSNVDGMNFCNNCGTKVEYADIDATLNKTNPIAPNKKSLNVMRYIFAFILLLGLIVIAFSQITFNDDVSNAEKNKDYAKDTFHTYYSVKKSDLIIKKDTQKWGNLKCGDCTYYEFDSYASDGTEETLFHNVMIIRTSDKAISWFLYSDNTFSTYMLKNNLDIDSHSKKHNKADISGN